MDKHWISTLIGAMLWEKDFQGDLKMSAERKFPFEDKRNSLGVK